MRRRVVVTGFGCLTPVGNDVATTWRSLLAGKSGAGPITKFDPAKFPVRFAAEVTAAVFAAIGVFALVWGAAHVWAGALLRGRRARGRLLTLGLAVINLLVFPFGTALGAYALWTLLQDEGRRLFYPAR